MNHPESPALKSALPLDSHTRGWLARLTLDFNVAPTAVAESFASPATEPVSSTPQGLRTRLNHQHLGPLRIQKALYPEGLSPCHAIIVHPPGGIAGGDRLEVLLHSRTQSHGLMTTPSAAKWYGSEVGAPASQNIDITLDGALEWLPQETIVFDRAFVESEISIHASEQGAMIGWDHLIFGRKASGEVFKTGRFAQSLRVTFSEGLCWHDRLVLNGDDALFQSPIGLRGHHAFATIWAIVPQSRCWAEETIQMVRAQCPEIAWTMLHSRLLVGRLLADPLQLKTMLERAWTHLRPIVLGRTAVHPRLWAT